MLPRLAALVATLMTAALLVIVAPAAPTLAAGDPCAPGGNKIACENSLPGTPMEQWDDISGAGASSIQGFSTQISVNLGQRVDFKIDTDARAYTIGIFRTGYYGGDGARKIADVTPSATLPQNQPNCISDVTTELYDCGNWAVSASWTVPSTAVSGVYIARLHRSDTGETSHITFIVRDDASRSDLVFQTSDTTWQAYNDYGGSNHYWGGANGRAYKVSYNRPVITRGGIGGRDFYMSNEYPLVRFLEKNGYDVSYIAGVDTHRSGQLLTNHKAFLSVGHDEYWTGPQRANVTAARDAGVNLMFLSGNEMYWRSRFEPSADGSSTPNRTLVTYKETWDRRKSDPTDEWTGTWRDPRYAAPSQGAGTPENALIGTMYMVNNDDLALTVSAEEGKLRLWRNTSLASLPTGTTRALAPHTVGYESNEDLDNGFRPKGLIRLSTTTGPTPEYLQDFGNTVKPGTTTHHMTMYRADSGALVFSAGTVQWTWGLDAVHDSPFPNEPADARMQQAQVNLLADMGAQPKTLQSGLVAAAPSTDTTRPTAAFTTPAAGSTRANGARVTVTGTASDVGGRVAAVEVSTDGGTTWHPASGTTSWSYDYIQQGLGAESLKVRAVDDSANIGVAATRDITVTCPCTAFGSVVPKVPASDDGSAAELGLRFTAKADGFISGVRFYKGAGNGGTHAGSLWSTAGQQLATATFTDETATGWQKVSFRSPVPVTAGQTLVVSYSAPQGHYAAEADAFASLGVEADPFSIAGGFGAPASGVYANVGQFPINSFGSPNYFVDAVFTTTDDSPLTASGHWPLAGSSSVPTSTTLRATFSKPVAPASVAVTLKDGAGNTVAGSTAYDAATRTATFTPSSPLAGFVRYTATLAATDQQGIALSDGKAWSFTTARPPSAPGVCPCSLFDDSTVPTVLEAPDSTPVTLGVRFYPDVAGTISGVRFYKGAGNTGTHTGALWSSDGTQLAEGTFTGESTSGWQTLTFAQPVTVSKNTEYVASYRTTVGKYSVTPNAFADSDLSRPPLRVAPGAGSYTYGAGFPSASSQQNYMVDVVFERPAPAIAVESQDPAPGAVAVPRSSTVRVWFTQPIAAGASMTVRQVTATGTTSLAGSTELLSDGTMLRFTPAAPLPGDADIRVDLTGVRSTEGAVLAAQTWTFRTRSATAAAEQTLFGDQVPQVQAADDGAPIEVGTAFSPTADGQVTALRFFKGAGNAGTHTGSLWSATGQRLATVTFAGETPSGWQTARLSSPVSVSEGTTYVVSYLAPQGHYSYTSGFFSQPWTAGDLTAPQENGRFLYAPAGGFPQYSTGSANYFADVVFEKSPATVAVASRTPGPGATGVARDVSVEAVLTKPVQPGYTMTLRQGTTSLAGTATLSTDGRTIVFDPATALPADAEITVTLSGVTSTEGATLGTVTWTFRTAPDGASSGTVSLFTGVVPQTTSVDDSGPVELGVAFTPSVNGAAQGVRFFKGAGNTGVHTGSIWSAGGTRLGTVTFTAESSSGWQTATFATPVALTAGQTYVVSYYAPRGHYSATPGYFADSRTVGPLSAPASGNGRYVYGSGGGLPTNSWNGTNYFVDLVFRQSSP